MTSIESAQGIWNLGSIAGWKSKHNPQAGGELSAILVRFLYSVIKEEIFKRPLIKFAAEDCEASIVYLVHS